MPIPLFSQSERTQSIGKISPSFDDAKVSVVAMAEAFNEVDADDLTPRAALELLYRLKALAEDDGG